MTDDPPGSLPREPELPTSRRRHADQTRCSADSRQKAKISVLYVDDEPSLLDIGRIYLERSGELVVDTALFTDRAFELLEGRGYDAIIADYQMPGRDGIEFLKEIRSRYGGIPFILFTGRGREEVVIEALNNGADFYLQKGGDPRSQFAELIHKVKTAVERRHAMDALIESEQRLADIINFLPDATFAIDTNRTVIAWNRAIEDLTGVPASEMIGRGNFEYALPFYGKRRPILIDLIFEPDDELTRTSYSVIGKDAGVLIAETTLPHPKGTTRILLGKASLLYDKKGSVAGAIESIRDITESRNVETALEESERRYRAVVEDQTEFISRFLPDGTHIFVNEAYCRYFGRRRNEIIGSRFVPAIPKEDRDMVRDHFASLTIDNPVGSVTHRIVMPDGQVRWQRWSDRAIFDAEGVLVEYQSVGRDVTQVMEAEKVLRESEAQYRLLVESSTDGVVVHQEGVVRFINTAGVNILGASSAAEIVGRRVIDAVHPDHREIAQQRIHAASREVCPRIEEKFLRVDGSSVDVDVVALPFVYKGEPAVMVVFHDITDRKRAEEESRRLKDFWAFIEMARDWIFIIDRDDRVIYVNAFAAESLGRSKEQVIGADRSILFPHAVNSHQEESLRRVFETGSPLRSGSGMDYQGRTIWLDTLLVPLKDDGGDVYAVMGISRDITALKKLEEDLRHSLLDIAEKNRTISQINHKLHLLSQITRHDITNKLAVLDGYRTLVEEQIDDPAIRELLDRQRRASGAIARILEFTRDYERIGSLVPSWQNVAETVQRVARMLDLGPVRCSVEVDGLAIMADPMLEKVFYNLLDNALRHGDHVTEIRVRRERLPDSCVMIVEDNGIGVPDGEKDRIFQYCHGRNTGLGLFLVREILTMTGIAIRETGTHGRGARFEMVVPPGGFLEPTAGAPPHE